jgi:hypothetical protein
MAIGPRIQIAKPKLLIVEGKDEEGFFSAAMSQHLSITDIQVLPIGGKQNLYGNLKALMLDPAFPAVTCVGVVRDADSTAPGAASTVTGHAATTTFTAIAGTLSSLGLPQPASHAAFTAGLPSVGVFVMPDGTNDGMLETLCINSCGAQNGFACVGGYFNCLAAAGVALPTNMHKAQAQAWLASRPEPGKRLGEAAQAGYWAWGSPAFSQLWAFIRHM